MELTVIRNRLKDEYTTGQLYIDAELFCFTLEDKVREKYGVAVEKWKVNGETAIPQGLYEITIEESPKFGPGTLTINKVPGFTGVRIHSGNSAQDTDGCLLVGYRINDAGVIVPGTSRPCLADLKRRVTLPCTIRILNQATW